MDGLKRDENCKTEKTNNNFPLDVFPKIIQDNINDYVKHNNANKDILANNVLNVAGFVLSKKFEFEVKSGWYERSNLFTISVMQSGLGKTHMFKAPLVGVEKKSKQLKMQFKNDLLVFKKIKDFIKNNKNNDDFKKDLLTLFTDSGWGHLYDKYVEFGIDYLQPKEKVLTVSDFTTEGMNKQLEKNDSMPILIKRDEISGVFGGFNKYGNGGGNDEESFLEWHDYENNNNKLRANDEYNVFVEDQTVSVMGNTQPAMLERIFTKDRIINGNIFRFLFVVDKEIRKEVHKLSVLDGYDKNHFADIEDMVRFFMMQFENKSDRIKLTYDLQTKLNHNKWLDTLIKKYKDVDDEFFTAAMGKLNKYIFRTVIIINRLRVYYENRDNIMSDVYVTDDDFKKAERLIEFYFNNIIDVVYAEKRFKNDIEKDFYYNDLPSKFKAVDFTTLFEKKFNASRRTALRRLKEMNEKGLLYKDVKNKQYLKTEIS